MGDGRVHETAFCFSPEYVEIAEDRLLQPVISWNSSVGTMMFVAVFLGKVRLIDNIRIF